MQEHKYGFKQLFYFIMRFFGLRSKQKDVIKDEYTEPRLMQRVSPLEENYLIDIRGSYYGGRARDTSVAFGTEEQQGKPPAEEVQKKVVKPIEVLEEIQMPVRDVDLVGIDQKIAVLEIKKTLIKQEYSKLDVENAIQRLKNRKKYREYRNFYGQFTTTTTEKIEELLNKYDLSFQSADLFIPELPDEIVYTIKEYQEKTVEICGKQTIIMVIATSDLFRKITKDRDPIILAQSPFGFYYDILGAYDKEMIMLSEL